MVAAHPNARVRDVGLRASVLRGGRQGWLGVSSVGGEGTPSGLRNRMAWAIDHMGPPGGPYNNTLYINFFPQIRSRFFEDAAMRPLPRSSSFPLRRLPAAHCVVLVAFTARFKKQFFLLFCYSTSARK